MNGIVQFIHTWAGNELELKSVIYHAIEFVRAATASSIESDQIVV